MAELTEEQAKEIGREAAKEVMDQAKFDRQMLLDMTIQHVGSPGRVIDAERARATPCKCFEYDSSTYCWSEGVLGLISSDKNPEQIQDFCKVKHSSPSNELKKRFEKFQEAASEAQKEYEQIPESKREWTDWLEAMSKSLEKHGIEVA